MKTQTEQKEESMIQLTGFNNVNNEIETQYGKIKFLDWLQLEKSRIKKDPERKAEIRKHQEGREIVSLYVNHVKGCHCEICKKVFPDSVLS